MHPPPQRLFDDSGPAGGRANYFRFRLQPEASIALAARVKRPGMEFVGVQRELYLGEDDDPNAMSTYERLLGAAMSGDSALFTDEDSVMAALWSSRSSPSMVLRCRTNPEAGAPLRPLLSSSATAAGTTR